MTNYLYRENFLTKEECKELINEGKKQLEKAVVFGEENEPVESSIRETNVSFFHSDSAVEPILKKIINEIVEVGLNVYGVCITHVEAMQYAEYEKGMFYGWHTDTGAQLLQRVKRDISASLILNDQSKYIGGSLQMVLPNNISKNNIITPQDVENQEQGTIIIFPSSMIHQVTPVTSGVRKSLVLWSRSNLKST